MDDQFEKAGVGESQIHECHGSIHHVQCVNGCSAGIWSAEGLEPVLDEQACRLLSCLPHCRHCGALARPNVPMFDDGTWRLERSEAQQREERTWLQQLARPRARVVVVGIGVGTAAPPVPPFSGSVSHA